MTETTKKVPVIISKAKPESAQDPTVRIAGRSWTFNQDEWKSAKSKDRQEKFDELVAKRILSEKEEMTHDELMHLLKVSGSKMEHVFNHLRLSNMVIARWNNLEGQDLIDKDQSQDLRLWLSDRVKAKFTSRPSHDVRRPQVSQAPLKPLTEVKNPAKNAGEKVLIKKLDK